MDQSLALGANLALPGVTTVATAPNRRLRLALASQADYPSKVTIEYRQDIFHVVEVTALAGHYGGAPAAWDLTVPDFAGVEGWHSEWGLQPATESTWILFAVGGSDERVNGVPADGATIRVAFRTSEPLGQGETRSAGVAPLLAAQRPGGLRVATGYAGAGRGRHRTFARTPLAEP